MKGEVVSEGRVRRRNGNRVRVRRRNRNGVKGVG